MLGPELGEGRVVGATSAAKARSASSTRANQAARTAAATGSTASGASGSAGVTMLVQPVGRAERDADVVGGGGEGRQRRPARTTPSASTTRSVPVDAHPPATPSTSTSGVPNPPGVGPQPDPPVPRVEGGGEHVLGDGVEGEPGGDERVVHVRHPAGGRPRRPGCGRRPTRRRGRRRGGGRAAARRRRRRGGSWKRKAALRKFDQPSP